MNDSMDPPFHSEEELFEAVASLPTPEERSGLLDRSCKGDPGLRSRIEGLLRAHFEAGNFLETLGDQTSQPPSIKGCESVIEAAGDWIGRYKLLQQIGEGGCGTVWMARQEEPVRRDVALKVIKLGMDTRLVIARFEAERQVLALMDHPCIAKVLDAGASLTGRPYFVMELVRGVRITDFCDQEKLSSSDRLRLFIQVCHAIQHAHQKGIIHRDLKPSNILVTIHDGLPVPKVIDFGIAKAISGQRLTDKTLFTAYEQFLGTPAYMSPEQAGSSALDVDTRSDIYSLGVLLYELLTSVTPFEDASFRHVSLDEIRRLIRDIEPARPSTRLRTLGEQLHQIARSRQTEAPRLIGLVRGDLDWIVMKCLEKERSRRYETANGLALDVGRHLNNEPVLARPPTAAYRFQKLARRNKLAFAFIAAVGSSLALGTVISLWQADRAAEAGLKAEHNAREARRHHYAADIKLVELALSENNLGRAVRLLLNHIPTPGEPDFRGFEWRYLWRLSQVETLDRFNFGRLNSEVLGFSPEGRHLAVGGLLDGVRILDVNRRREVLYIPSATNAQLNIQFSKDGELLLTAGPDSVELWDARTGEWSMALPGAAGFAAFSPDGRNIVSNSPKGIQIWDRETGQVQQHLADQMLRVQWNRLSQNLAFSQDVSTMVALVEDQSMTKPQTILDPGRVSIRIWDFAVLRASGIAAPSIEIRAPDVSTIAALTLSGDGRLLAATSVLGKISIWDTRTGELLAENSEPANRTQVLLFLPDGTLVGGRADQTLRVWQIRGRNLVEIALLRGHLAAVNALTLSPDGTVMASGDSLGEVKLWDVTPSGLDQHSEGSDENLPGQLNHLAFLSDHRTLLSSGLQVSFSDTLTHQARLVLPHDSWRAAVRISPDQRLLAQALTNGMVNVLNLPDLSLAATVSAATSEVRRIFFTPDSQFLLTGTVLHPTADGELFPGESAVRLWEAASGTLVLERDLGRELEGLVMEPNGEFFAVSFEGTIEVRETRTFERRFELLDGRSYLRALAISPDGRLLAAAGSLDSSVRLWDLQTRQVLREFQEHTDFISGVAFSPDGQTLATSSHNHTVRLWNVATGQEMLALPQKGGAYEPVFSADGNRLAIGTYLIDVGAEGMNATFAVRLYHAPSLEEIEPHLAPFHRGARSNSPNPGFSADGLVQAQRPSPETPRRLPYR